VECQARLDGKKKRDPMHTRRDQAHRVDQQLNDGKRDPITLEERLFVASIVDDDCAYCGAPALGYVRL